MLQTRSDALIVVVKNTVAGGSVVQISNSAGWIVTLGAGGALVGTINTIAIGGGNTVTIVNSGGLYAQQSGPWTVAVSNTGGAVTLLNSSNQATIVTNSQNWVIFAQQSGSWTQANTATAINITNSAGWVFAQSNTANQSATIVNSSALAFVNTTINIVNTAGWVIAQSNTGGAVTVANSSSIVQGYDISQVWDGTNSLKMQYATIAVSNSSNNVVVNAISSKRIRVMSVFLISSQTNNIIWQSDSSSAVNLTGTAFLAANVGYVLPFHPNGWFQTGTSTLLNLNLSLNASIGGCITYLQTS